MSRIDMTFKCEEAENTRNITPLVQNTLNISAKKQKQRFVKINSLEILYNQLMSKMLTKILISGLYILYWSFALVNVTRLSDGLSLPDLVDNTSYLRPYLIDFFNNFELSPLVMIVIDKPVDYTDKQVEREINSLLDRARRIDGLDERFVFNWMDYFEYQLRQSHRNKTILAELKDDISPFANDIIFDYNQTFNIIASRFYLKYKSQYLNSIDARPMNELRNLCKHSPLPVFPYAITFKNYEQLDESKSNAYQIGLLSFESIYLVSMAFIPDIMSNLCMSLTFFSIYVGVLGLFRPIGLALNPVSLISLFVSLVPMIYYSTYFMFPFLKNGADTRTKRAYSIISYTGATMAYLAMSMGASMVTLLLASSYMFVTMSKIFLIVQLVGLLNALVFVPTILSVTGSMTRIQVHMEASAPPDCKLNG
jgi:hypothetical protein